MPIYSCRIGEQDYDVVADNATQAEIKLRALGRRTEGIYVAVHSGSTHWMLTDRVPKHLGGSKRDDDDTVN